MERIINLGIPHVGEQIFQSLSSDHLIQCLKVSSAWKVLAENILYNRWKGNFSKAYQSDKSEIVRILLEHSKSEEIESMIKAAFAFACENGRRGVVKTLLNHQYSKYIDFNATNNFGYTAFYMACHNGHKYVVKLLLDNPNIEFNTKRDNGWKAFIVACKKGQTDVVKLLLEHLRHIGNLGNIG